MVTAVDRSDGRAPAGISRQLDICWPEAAAYRQVGNAFPPPVAEAVGRAIYDALLGSVERPIQLELLAGAAS